MGLSLEDFILFRDFIHERSGIYFGENRKQLVEDRLRKRLDTLGMKSFRDYFYQVKYDSTSKEFNALMNLMTTNETSFFRDPAQWQALQEEVLPALLRQREESGAPRGLRFWSAGCSTGEEPYTLAMVLLELLGETSSQSAEIVATDISEQVLYSARRGSYREMTLRSTPAIIVEKYFRQRQGKYEVVDRVKRLVRFSQLNLADRHRAALIGDFDIILCRNVLVYFSTEVKRAVVRRFTGSLRPGGYLFIGRKESMHGISRSLRLTCFRNGLAYRKDESRVPAVTAAPVLAGNVV